MLAVVFFGRDWQSWPTGMAHMMAMLYVRAPLGSFTLPIDNPIIYPRESGRAFDFEFSHKGSTYVCRVGRELLADEVGSDATQSDRESYLQKHLEQILEACRAKIDGRAVREPFASGIWVKKKGSGS